MLNQEKTGKLIAALRKERKMTQEQLAEKLGVSNRSVSRWENGKTMPDLSLLPVLGEELGVSVTELLNGEKQAAEERKVENIRKIIEKSNEEKRHKAKKVNTYFLMGLICIVIVILNGQFGILDFVEDAGGKDFLVGILTGLGLTFEIAGFYYNSRERKMNERELAVLANETDHVEMRTAEEMLRFAWKSQKADLPQYMKAFAAIEKELQPEEKVLFTLVGKECFFGESPACWHPVLAMTEQRILISGESIRGRMMTFYGVDSFEMTKGMKVHAKGNTLYLQVGEVRIKFSGEHMEEAAGNMQKVSMDALQ